MKEKKIDALAIDMFPGLTPICGMIPCVGMARILRMRLEYLTD